MKCRLVVKLIFFLALVSPSAADEPLMATPADELPQSSPDDEPLEIVNPADLFANFSDDDYFADQRDQCIDKLAADLAECESKAAEDHLPAADRGGIEVYWRNHHACYSTFQTQSLSCECDFPINGQAPSFCSNECALEEMACTFRAEAYNIACRELATNSRDRCNARGASTNRNCRETETPSCPHYGCTEIFALNYSVYANIDDGSCIHEEEEMPEEVPGCTDATATNFQEDAVVDDGSCVYEEEVMPVETHGCTDPSATNHQSNADVDDGSCVYEEEVMPEE